MTDPPLIRVTLRGIPVELWAATRDWFTGLLREFQIIASAKPDDAVPERLVTFVAEVEKKFARFSRSGPVLDDAVESGTEYVDVDLDIPESGKSAAIELWELIVETEDYCRSGQLLTLIPPAEARRFVEWYLHEVARQVDGSEPIPWDSSADGARR